MATRSASSMRPPVGQQCRDSLLGGGKTVEHQTAIAVN
jgi:hypothetical protein